MNDTTTTTKGVIACIGCLNANGVLLRRCRVTAVVVLPLENFPRVSLATAKYQT